MSKAFTRENDQERELPLSIRASAALPPGTKNYLTADGAVRFRAELDRLQNERPTSSADENRTGTERRIAELQQILTSAEVVPLNAQAGDNVRFGSTVTVRDEKSDVTAYRIVGVDEMDFDRGWVSWLSPLARALINAKVGQRVVFESPAGKRTLTVLRIESAPLTH